VSALHRPTPSKHPYRPFAAAWRRRRIATASPAPQRGYHGARYEATTRAITTLRGYYEATTRLLRGYYAGTRLLRGYYEAATRPLPGHYQATTRLPRGYYQEPHARHSASSTAAAAPLVYRRRSRQQLGAGADDPHTNGKTLEEVVLHMPNKLDNSEDQACHISSCSRMQLVCSPACTPTSPTKTSTRQASRP
jgi:hypothetical protein